MTRQVESYNETPAANNFDIDEGGAPESHQRVKVNDSNRERMSALASFYQSGIEWLDLLRDPTDRSISFPVAKASDTTIDITSGTNDLSSLFNEGRRIKTTDGGVDTDELEVLSVAYSNPTTTVTIYSAQGDTVTADIDGLLLHSSAALKRFAFRDTLLSQYILLNGLTDADFAAAIAQVVTDGGGTILLPVGTVALTGQHSIPIDCRILGQGIGISILDSSSNTETSILDVASGFNTHFESFTLIGGPGAGAGTEHGIFFHTGGVADSRINDVLFQFIEGDAIRFEGCTIVREMIISGCTIESPGGNGIYCDDDNTNVERCSISDCTLQAFGGQIGTTSYGIRVAGEWKISDISISGLGLAGPAQQVGLALWEKVAANPNEQDAHHCSVSGISVTGTGAEARGIDMNGRFCSVTGANINLTGASSTGVRVGGTLGSQLAQNNKLSASSITAAVGYDETNTAATRNSVVGCSFQTCGVALRLAAAAGHYANNTIEGSTVDDIQVANNASDNHILGNSLRDSADNGIRVQSGASGTLIMNNIIDGAAGDGIEAESGSTNTRVSQNRCLNVTGADYTNGATTEGHFYGNFPGEDETFAYKTANQTFDPPSAPTNISNLTGIEFPTGDGGPDGHKTYTIEIDLPHKYTQDAASDFSLIFQLFMGANGTKADSQFQEWTINHGLDDTVNVISPCGFLLTPAAGDKLGLVLDFGSPVSADRATVYGSTNLNDNNDKATIRIRRVRNET